MITTGELIKVAAELLTVVSDINEVSKTVYSDDPERITAYLDVSPYNINVTIWKQEDLLRASGAATLREFIEFDRNKKTIFEESQRICDKLRGILDAAKEHAAEVNSI